MKIKIFFIIFIVTILFSQSGNVVLAASCKCGGILKQASGCESCISQGTNCRWDGSTNCNGGSGNSGKTVTLDNPLGTNVTPQIVIGRVVNAALGIVGSLALVMFVFGGITWMTAAGSPEKVAKGRSILVWATLGMIVVFSSYTLVRFIIERGLGA